VCEQILSGILVAAAKGGIVVRVVLTGFRGTGKTTVGRSLARELGLPFMDTDTLIESREGMNIHEIFRLKGEAYFRKVEKEIIRTLPQKEVVIATGGGAVLDAENVEALRAGSTIILLSADADTIVQRIQKSRRPPLTELPLPEEVRYLLKTRGPFYRKAADYCLETGREEIPALVRRILRLIRGKEIPFTEVQRILDSIPALRPEDRRIIEEQEVDGCPLRLFAVIGDPVSHSRSPPLFNALFAHYHLPHRYVRLESPSVRDLLELTRVRDFRGLSVTIPHKPAVISYLDEVDPVADEIGAVNTIVHCGRTLYGYNTDWLGIQRPLAQEKGKKAVVLGAGGAAAAAIYACRDLSMQVTVLNRTPERGAALAERFGCASAPLSAFPRLEAEVVINATPVGMEPDTRSPVPSEWLRPEMVIFDLVYTPPLTPLLREAKNIGCSTISGIQMFIHQAREQFLLFTGISAPLSLIQDLMP
jgi:shikimate dehydrogenase